MGGNDDGLTMEEQVTAVVDSIYDNLPEPFDMADLYGQIDEDERTPFTAVVLQECTRMNIILDTLRRTLEELSLGLAGSLTMTDRMEALMDALFLDKVPESWSAVAYPSMFPLGIWFKNLQKRVEQLQVWSTDFKLPKSIWL